MIIDCVSDLHGFYPRLDGGDLLIIAGDLTARDKAYEYAEFFLWLNKQPYRKKVLIAGNHDNELEKCLFISKFLPETISYLCDSGCEMVTESNRLKIWGTPWTKTFPGINPRCCAFTVDTDEELAKKWELIPDDIDILITHSPPYGILDGIENHDGSPFHVGSHSLLQKITNAPNAIKLWVFGHIHEAYGKTILKRPGFGSENNTTCVNASYVNERYQPVNNYTRIQFLL